MKKRRAGFTLVELLVVIAIIGVLVALLLPAVQMAREAARRSTCENNMKQLGIAVLNFESGNKALPTSGEGKILGSATKGFDMHSTYTYLLPYLEQEAVYDNMNLAYLYNSTNAAAPTNIAAAKTQIQSFLCPSHPYRQPDPFGYGQADYMPIAYCDIGAAGVKDPTTTSVGFLALTGTSIVSGSETFVQGIRQSQKGGSTIASCKDGSSNTVCIIEDVGKNFETTSPFMVGSSNDPGDDKAPSGIRSWYRWAEPDIANGVSGPNNATDDKTAKINNHPRPYPGGPSTCPWGGPNSASNNCGPNDEPFSFHTAGAVTVFGDGHVQSVSFSINYTVLRQIMTPRDGIPIAGDL
jgi:prepilin-type N-terminal cleavage/methylation domain-containing protein